MRCLRYLDSWTLPSLLAALDHAASSRAYARFYSAIISWHNLTLSTLALKFMFEPHKPFTFLFSIYYACNNFLCRDFFSQSESSLKSGLGKLVRLQSTETFKEAYGVHC